ncbi:MAG: hypothetical protein GBAus27B_000607 [Mycoplasmataceae bacterium]|nr:MAG: hypothetical protein GBAus27B_000607 [Mycoplasmataceae bacterium]
MNLNKSIKKCTKTCESAQKKIMKEIKLQLKDFEAENLLEILAKVKSHD